MNRGNGVINGDLARRDAEACVNGGMRLVEAPSVAFVTRISATDCEARGCRRVLTQKLRGLSQKQR